MTAPALCKLCRHQLAYHGDDGCGHDDPSPCPCGAFVPDTEPTVEPVLCPACDHPAMAHHVALGCQRQLPGGLLGNTHTCACALGPEGPGTMAALLDISLDRTEAMLADDTECTVAPDDPADVAHAAYLLGLCAGALHRQGYRPDNDGPYELEVPLAGGRIARIWCRVHASTEPF